VLSALARSEYPGSRNDGAIPTARQIRIQDTRAAQQEARGRDRLGSAGRGRGRLHERQFRHGRHHPGHRRYRRVRAAPATTPCDWDLANWGGGWSFSPDYEPTGEQLFLSGAVANSGGYADPHDDALINATLTNSDVQAMYDWQEYLSSQLPMLWQPNADYQLNEIADNLRGVTPMSPTLSINPENWYFVR
jgi:hypothetical protein